MRLSTLSITIAVVLASATACGDALPIAPASSSIGQETTTRSGPLPPPARASIGATLIECPTSVTTSDTALITPLGGSVSSGGTSITIPAGALLVPTPIVVTVPASKYMEVRIRAAGSETFNFLQPVTIAIGYARCTRNDIEQSALTAWYIDSENKTLLEFMGGTDDKVSRSVTFTTDHLSGYALAN